MVRGKEHDQDRSRISDCWAENRGIRLHYLDSGREASRRLVPVAFVPGALGTAELYRREMQSLAPRRCVAMSLRGRGKSEAPERGYTFEDNVSDVESVIHDSRLTKYALVAYSMGVPYAIECAARDPRGLKGLVLGDYAARSPPVKHEWIGQSLRSPGTNPLAVVGLQRDSREVNLWERLEEIGAPVLVIKGGKPGSMLSAESVELYRRHLRDVVVVEFEDSDHAIFKPSYDKYIGTIKDFIERIDDRLSPSEVV